MRYRFAKSFSAWPFRDLTCGFAMREFFFGMETIFAKNTGNFIIRFMLTYSRSLCEHLGTKQNLEDF